MPDVFVSYSRRDQSFVGRLVADLERRGKTVWVDTEKIGDGEVFPEAIREAIEQSDSFVFVITPNSVESPYCENEVEYALELQKRIVPLLRAEVPDADLPEAIRVRNWIPFTDEHANDGSPDRLVAALDTDLDYTRAHTRYLVKALEWEAGGRTANLLLRGDDLTRAEQWAVRASDGADPEPTTLQRDFILQSRAGSTRRQRWIVAGSVVVAAISVALVAFALISRGQAQTARTSAEADATSLKAKDLAAESQTQLFGNPERATLLAEAAVRTDPLPAATFALQRALDVSPVLGHLANVGPQSQGGGYGADIAWRPGSGPRQIAESSQSGYLWLINPTTLKTERKIKLEGGQFAAAVAYNPAGTILAASGYRGTRLINPDTGKTLGLVKSMANAYRVVFSRNGELLAGTANASRQTSRVEIYDLRTGKLLVLPEGKLLNDAPDGVGALSFLADGRRLVVGSSRGLAVFDVPHRRLLRTTDRHAETDPMFSPTGSTIAVAQTRTYGVRSATLRLMTADLKPFAVVSLPHVLGGANAMAYSPDGKTIAFGTTTGQLYVYSLADHELVYQVRTPDEIEDLAYSPDGRKLVITHENGDGEVLRATGPERTAFNAGAPIGNTLGSQYLAFSGNGLAVTTPYARHRRRAATAIWSLEGRRQTQPVITPSGVGISFDGSKVMRLTSPPHVSLRIWNLRSGRRVPDVFTWESEAPNSWDYENRELFLTAFAAGANGAPDGALEVLNTKTGSAYAFASGNCPYYTSVFAPAAAIAAAIDNCGHIRLAHLGKTNAKVNTFPNHYWDSAGLVLSGDGKYLAITNATNSNDVQIISTTTQRLVTTLTGETDVINDAEFSPNDHYVVTASGDHSARLWKHSNWSAVTGLQPSRSRATSDLRPLRPDDRHARRAGRGSHLAGLRRLHRCRSAPTSG